MPDSYRVADLLFAGEYPFAPDPTKGRSKLAGVLDAGITSFVDLTTPADRLLPYAALLTEFADAGSVAVRHFAHGIPDNDVPDTPALMRRILDTIDAEIRDGRRIYVHCWGGVGRTGLVVGCYLVRKGMTGGTALKKVRSLFETMSPERVERHAPGAAA
jgi:protein-tyrosine phosphatase